MIDNEEVTKLMVEEIIETIDSSTLLGAAYDCMSVVGKTRLKDKITAIIVKNNGL